MADEEDVRDLSRERNPRDRLKRADLLEERVEAEARRLSEQRRDDIERAAFERGVAAEKITARLNDVDRSLASHERRLNAINGSIERTGQSLNTLSHKIDQVAAKLEQRDAVNEALVKKSNESGAAHMTRLQRYAVTSGILFPLATVAVLIIQTVAGH